MTLYALALFAHIIGAILLFAALTVEGLSFRLRFSVAEYNRVIGPISGLLILIPGLYMARVQWGFAPWIVFGIAVWVLIANPGSMALLSWFVRIALGAVVLFDMVVKP